MSQYYIPECRSGDRWSSVWNAQRQCVCFAQLNRIWRQFSTQR